jgi:YesN/AraC family two-component response regulator
LALEHFKINHKDYSIIISDIRMPVMNGFQFVSEARKINPKVKILLMTTFEIDDKEFARVLPKPKIDGLIRKPASSKQNTEYSFHCSNGLMDYAADNL